MRTFNFTGLQFTTNLNNHGHTYKVIEQNHLGTLVIENQSYKNNRHYNSFTSYRTFVNSLCKGNYTLVGKELNELLNEIVNHLDKEDIKLNLELRK